MLNRIARYISDNQLLNKERTQLVAISGGADSVCLLLALLHQDYLVEAVHCNFHLRGEESNRDEEFVKRLCKERNVKLHLMHFDTNSYAELHKVSIEMAARELRYRYFEQLRQDLHAENICVAHHQDDSVETILINLLRGTGIHGLLGIKPRNGHIVRPLLCVNRAEIEAWLKSEQQKYITDSTNLIDDVVRNKLRLNIFPQLEAITPSASESILKTAQRLAEVAKVYDKSMNETIQRLKKVDSIDIRSVLKEPSAESVLFEWLKPLGFSPSAIEQIALTLKGSPQAGQIWQSATHQCTISQGRFIVEPKGEPLPTLRIPESGTYVYNHDQRLRLNFINGQHVKKEPTSACLDASKVTFPLMLRPMMAGDRFQPFGMKGSKLVSDFLTDRHLSVFEKQRTLVLCDAKDNILWVVDHRPDNRFCINTSTTNTLMIEHEQHC